MMQLQKAQFVKKVEKITGLEISGFRGELYDFQKTGILWMYFAGNCLLADSCGLGKTIESLALLLLLKSRNELKGFILAVPSASLGQWREEIIKFTDLNVMSVGRLSKNDRILRYATAGRVDGVLLNHELLYRDLEYLRKLNYNVMILDEASVIKNYKTKTAQAVKELAGQCERFIACSATPVQNNLMDLHSIFEAINPEVLGGYWRFRNKFCVTEEQFIYVRGIRRRFKKIVGSKDVDELKELIEPYYLRRRLGDVNIKLPVVPRTIWLELLPEQKEIYKKLRKKTIDLYNCGRRREVKKNVHSMQQCVDGLGSLEKSFGDKSSKLDKVMELLKGDLNGEKVVVFSKYKNTLFHLKKRFLKEGIKFVEISGDVNKEERERNRKCFWEDKECQVCCGTVAMNLSLNLQIARYLIMINTLYNPTKVEQFLGRIRRIDSKHKSVVLILLLTVDTFEEKLYSVVRGRQDLIDDVFDEKSDIFEKLSVDEIMEIIK